MKASDAILDYAFDLQCKVEHLVSVNASHAFNRPDLMLESCEVLFTLNELHSEGQIVFLEGAAPVLQDICNPSDIDYRWYISLTEKGGERWEIVFCPDWTRYVDVSCSCLDGRSLFSVVIQAGCSDTLKRFEFLFRQKLGAGSGSNILQLCPWNPVYWKTVNTGYTVTYQLYEDNMGYLLSELQNSGWRRNWVRNNSVFTVVA